MLNDKSRLNFRTLDLVEFLKMGKSKKKTKSISDKLMSLVRSLPLLKCKIVEYNRNIQTKAIQIRGKRRITQDYEIVWVGKAMSFTRLNFFRVVICVLFYIIIFVGRMLNPYLMNKFYQWNLFWPEIPYNTYTSSFSIMERNEFTFFTTQRK